MNATLPLTLLAVAPAPEASAAPVPAPGYLLAAVTDPPGIVLLGIVGLGILVFGIQWLRYVLTRRSAVQQFESFKGRVMRLREGVEALKERHKLLTVADKDYSEPMTGQTLKVYEQVQADSGRLWDGWLLKMEVWDRAQGLIQSARFLQVRSVAEARRLLAGIGSLDEVEQLYQACVGHMDRLEQAHEQAQADLKSVENTTAGVRQQLEEVRRAPLPTAPFEPELASCGTLTEEARAILRNDPLGAQATLGQARQRLTALGGWMERTLAQLRRAPQVRERLEESASRVADARARGLRLTEPGGNPDPLLAQGRAHHEDAVAVLQRAEDVAAAKLLDQAQALADEARTLIDRQAAARARCQEQLPARRAEAHRLRTAAGEARRQREELERAFAADSWRNVADHVARAEGLLHAVEPLLDQAATAAADSTQHYFRAVALLEQAEKQQHEADGLVRAVGDCLHQLTRLRQECQASRQELDSLALRIQRFIDTNDVSVRPPARDRLRQAEERRRSAGREMALPRPHWPMVRQQLDAAQGELAAASQEAEADVRSHQELLTRLEAAWREVRRVGELLERHREDRPRANQRYRDACDRLDRLARESRVSRADWTLLQRQVQESVGELAEAERLAREDIQLAQQAAAEIAEAEREVARARDYRWQSITADVTPAERTLAEARHLLDTQAYEQALDRAGAARRAARSAHDEAVARAGQEQRRQEEERRRLESLATPGELPGGSAAPTPPMEGNDAPPTPWTPGNQGMIA